MSDRFKGFIVTLEDDMREDDAQSTIAALSHIKGVLAVEPMISNPADIIAERRLKELIRTKLRSIMADLV